MELTIKTNNLEETYNFADKLASLLKKQDVVTLSGDLGAGKTTLVSRIAKTFEVKEKVSSPTFNILKCYFSGILSIYHIDAYRLEDANKDIGLEEFIEGDGICFIEWPMFIKEYICVDFLEIIIKNIGPTKREFTLKSKSEKYDKILKEF